MKVLAIQAPRMQADDAILYLEKTFKKFDEQDFQLAVLPEKWITTAMGENDPLLNHILDFFCDFSRKKNCTVIPGSFSIERSGRLYNSSPFIHNGGLHGFQDKISLFKAENGRYTRGKEIRVFDAEQIKVSIAVCYDLDFPYYAKMAIKNGAALIVNPSLIDSEFKDMWHIYVKGRSLETRLPVISVNSISDPFRGGSIITRMRPENGGIFLESELLGNAETTVAETNPELMGKYIESRDAEDPGSYALDSRDNRR